MNVLRDKRGLSRVELLSIVVICICLVFFLVAGINMYQAGVKKSRDNLTVETAESLGRISYFEQGTDTLYFDEVSQKLVEYLPKGYNQYDRMTIDGREYTGEPGTMVVKAEIIQDNVVLSWVEGEN